MYIRVTNPLFLELGDSGRPAAGYLVYTLVAGTVATLLTTYADKDLTVPNTNPIVLNARGEAHIFTPVALKLVYTSPTGDLSSPIWTEDYVTELQNVVSDAGVGTWEGNNNYAVDIVPAYTSISGGFSLSMIPDATNLGTLVVPVGQTVPTVFTGTGVNDGVFSGKYTGSVPGSVFSVTIDAPYVAAPDAPTLAANAAVGLVTAGNHSVKLTAVTAEGETDPSVASNVISAAGSQQLDVTGIPAIGGSITGYNVYMNKAGGSIWYFVALVTTTTYTINVADASLTEEAPTDNTTGDADGKDTFSWQVDGGAAVTGVPITGDAQSLQDGVYITFARSTDHTFGDSWTLEVMTPVRLNFCGLGNILVYKSTGGALEVLDASDIIKDYPAHLDYSSSQNCWILINPSLPTLSSIIPLRRRKDVTTNYTVDPAVDQGTEINGIDTLTITLPACVDAVSHFFYFRNGGTGIVTLDAGAYNIHDVGQSTMVLVPYRTVQLVTNGVDWHIVTSTGGLQLVGKQTLSATSGATFSNLVPGLRYKLVYRLTQSTNSNYHYVRFNGDGGANYEAILITMYNHSNLSFTDGIYLAENVTVGYLVTADIDFVTDPANAKKVNVSGTCVHHRGAGGTMSGGLVYGYYSGAADLTSIALITPATVSGEVSLYVYV